MTIEFLKDCISTGTNQYFVYKDYSFLFEPIGFGVEIWHYGTLVGFYKTLDDFLNNFMIYGKLIKDVLEDVDFY